MATLDVAATFLAALVVGAAGQASPVLGITSLVTSCLVPAGLAASSLGMGLDGLGLGATDLYLIAPSYFAPDVMTAHSNLVTDLTTAKAVVAATREREHDAALT